MALPLSAHAAAAATAAPAYSVKNTGGAPAHIDMSPDVSSVRKPQ